MSAIEPATYSVIYLNLNTQAITGVPSMSDIPAGIPVIVLQRGASGSLTHRDVMNVRVGFRAGLEYIEYLKAMKGSGK